MSQHKVTVQNLTTFEVELVFCYWANVNRLMYALSLEGVVGDGG